MKEVGRWVFFGVAAWFIAETLNQSGAIPEIYSLKLWVFTYAIPVRGLFVVALTVLQRIVDRLVHESNKIDLNGILPW